MIIINKNNLTIKDIAKKAKVSVSTVSRVLNNKPDVSEKTRKKILDIIKKHDYKPNNVARGLKLKETYSIGLIIPDISNPFFPEVARGVEDIGNDNSYSVILSNTDNDYKREKESIKFMLNKQVDGLIVSLSTKNKKMLLDLEKENFPIVQLDRNIVESKYPSVTSNNIESAYKATEYLIDKGYKNIAHITGDLSTHTARDRKKGYLDALEAHNLDLANNFIQTGNYSEISGYNAMNKILKFKDRSDAVFVANDLMCLGVYQACKENKIKIPDDIAVIGHDNIEFSKFIEPPLTTMSQKKYQLGQEACDMLLKMIEQKKTKSSNFCGKNIENKILSTDLVIRQSS